VAVFVGIGMIASATTTDSSFSPGAEGGAANPTDVSLAGTLLAPLVLGALGVLLMSSEYSTGTIRSTLAAVPKRLPVVLAKVAVFVGVVFPLMLAATFTAFFGGQALLGDHSASLGDAGVLRAVIGTAAYLTGIGVFGLLLGVLLRSTPVAMTTLFGVVFLLQGTVELVLPKSWREEIGPYLPVSAGNAFGSVAQPDGYLTPWAGLGVFILYLTATGALAVWWLKRRDA
jgi:hypothetical protein